MALNCGRLFAIVLPAFLSTAVSCRAWLGGRLSTTPAGRRGPGEPRSVQLFPTRAPVSLCGSGAHRHHPWSAPYQSALRVLPTHRLLPFALSGQAACFRVHNALRLTVRSANPGDTRTNPLHPAPTIYSPLWKHEQEETGVTDDLIRLSLGVEHPEDILADLEQALRAA